MTDLKTKTDKNPIHQKQFNWGPPSNSTAEGFKDWLVYIIIVILLAVGVWLLLDISGQKADMTTDNNSQTSLDKNEKSETTETIAKEPPRHYVQLGAFADKESARDVFEQLSKEGFSPVLAEPDHQYEIYRIFLGPFQGEAIAEEVAEKLNALDFVCFVIEQDE